MASFQARAATNPNPEVAKVTIWLINSLRKDLSLFATYTSYQIDKKLTKLYFKQIVMVEKMYISLGLTDQERRFAPIPDPIRKLNPNGPIVLFGVEGNVYAIRHDSDIVEIPANSPKLPYSCDGFGVKFDPLQQNPSAHLLPELNKCFCLRCKTPMDINERSFRLAIDFLR